MKKQDINYIVVVATFSRCPHAYTFLKEENMPLQSFVIEDYWTYR